MAIPAEHQKWLDDHGGVTRTEGPDANGVTTYYAADGNYIAIGANGTPRMRGVAPATNTNAQPAASAAATPSGGGGMNQQEVEAWIAQQGGAGAVQHSSEKKRVPNPAFSMTLPDGSTNPQYQPGQPQIIEVASEMWVNSKTGARLHVSRKDDGSFDVIENQGADPNKPQTGQPARTPEQTTVEQSNAALAAREKQEREKNAALPADQDPAYETDAERRKRAQDTIDRQGREAQQNRPTVTIKEDASGRLVSISTDPRTGNSTVTPLGVQGTPQQVKGPDGNTYERGADGTYKPVAGVPDTRTPYTGPKPIQIVTGHAAEALQATGDRIARDPSLSPAQREKMWGEAIQVANIGIAEFGVQEREREANLNASVNLATNRQKAESDAFTTALKFATDLNDKLPAGSPLGGQAFVVMLGMQIIQNHHSGLYDIKPGTPAADAAARPSPVPASTLPPLGNGPASRAAVEAQRQEVAQQTAQVAQQRSAPSGDAQVGNPNVAPPPAAARPNPAALAAASPGSEDALLQQNQAAAASVPTAPAAGGGERDDDILTIHRKAEGDTIQLTRAQYNEQLRQYPYLAQAAEVVNAEANPARMAPPPVEAAPFQDDQRKPGYGTEMTISPTVEPGAAGATDMPLPSLNTLPQSMAPPSPAGEFAALAPYRPQAAQPSSVAPQGFDARQSPALLHAQAASVPPWRLSPQQIEQMQAAGVPEDVIFSVPGMPQQRQVA